MRSLDAAEIGGTRYAPEGGVLGLVAGIAVVFGFTGWGNLATNPVGLIIGAVGVIGGLTASGFVIGRAMVRHAPDAHLFAGVVRNGAIVSVRCADNECDLAAQLLDGAGAREVRDEPGPEVI